MRGFTRSGAVATPSCRSAQVSHRRTAGATRSATPSGIPIPTIPAGAGVGGMAITTAAVRVRAAAAVQRAAVAARAEAVVQQAAVITSLAAATVLTRAYRARL